MTTKETKRMHYVPQVYLNKFCESENLLHGIRKTNGERFCDKVENLCAKNNLYKFDSDKIEERQALETFYSKSIESKYNEVYAILTNKDIHDFDDNFRKDLIGFIISLFFRNNSWFQGFSEFMESNLEYSYQLVTQNNLEKQIYFEDELWVDFNSTSVNEAKKKVKNDVKQSMLLSHFHIFNSLVQLRINDNIFIERLEEEHEFITSDFPVYMFDKDNKFVVPFNLNNSISLAIDTKHSVKLMRSEFGKRDNRFMRTDRKGLHNFASLSIMNDTAYRNASHYILGTKNGLEKYLLLKEALERYEQQTSGKAS